MEIMEALLYIGFLISFSLIFYKLIFPTRLQYKNFTPSPPGIPILGHIHLFKKTLHHALHNLSTKYGSLLFIWFLWRPVLVVSTPFAIEECFTKNVEVFANRPLFSLRRQLESNINSLIMTPYGSHWRNLRRFATVEILSSTRIQMTSRIRADEIQYLVKKLFAGGNRKVDVNSLFYVLSFNVAMKMVSGERYFEGDEIFDSENVRKKFDDIKQTFSMSVDPSAGDFFPLIKYLSSVSEDQENDKKEGPDFAKTDWCP